jgi:hypothetical protein
MTCWVPPKHVTIVASHRITQPHDTVALHRITQPHDTVALHRITQPHATLLHRIASHGRVGCVLRWETKGRRRTKKNGLCFESESSPRRCARQARKVDFSLLRLANAASLAFKVADLTVPQLDPPTVRTLADPSLREGVDHSGCVTWQREVLINQCE